MCCKVPFYFLCLFQTRFLEVTRYQHEWHETTTFAMLCQKGYQAYHKNQAIILVTVLSTKCLQTQRKLAFAVIERLCDLMSTLVVSDL